MLGLRGFCFLFCFVSIQIFTKSQSCQKISFQKSPFICVVFQKPVSFSFSVFLSIHRTRSKNQSYRPTNLSNFKQRSSVKALACGELRKEAGTYARKCSKSFWGTMSWPHGCYAPLTSQLCEICGLLGIYDIRLVKRKKNFF